MNPITETSMVDEPLVDDQSRELDGSPIDQPLIEPAGANTSVMRRLVKTLMLVVALIGGGVFGLYKMRVDIPALNTPKIYAHLDSMGVRAEQMKGYVVGQYESHFGKHVEEEVHHEQHKIMITSPMAKDVIITQEYVCQIRSRRHIDVCALESGYLEAIPVKEGQAVKEGELMFEVKPILYKARWDAELAERDLAQLELTYTQTLAEKQGVSPKEVSLYKAKLAKAQAKADLAQAELNFAQVKAPFDGIIDRLKVFQGSLVKEGDILTTLSDNSVMWVYFNVTEKRYLEYMAETGQNKFSLDVELVLANHNRFPHPGKIDPAHKIGAIEANFNNETGNIAFRADFPNPVVGSTGERLLRHGQTGTVLINRLMKGAIVIPQRATFENLAKRYAYVVGKDDVVHQREIVIDHELDDIFVIGGGLDVNDRIILEGIRQVRDGEKVEYEFLPPEKVMANQKNHAE
jgi:membrane fusion protein (multidrug efflux system)